ncbi:MAG: mechanosensitive ion channel [Flavisolibacter sp.]|nr:mechanosensitive ion channel [Flavisolibacter sp.]
MQQYISDLLNKWHLPAWLWNTVIISASVLLGLLISFILSFFVKKDSGTVSRFILIQSGLKHLAKPLSVWIPLFVFDVFLPLLQMPQVFHQRLGHAVEIALILASSWTLISFIHVLQDWVRHRINVNTPDNLQQRRIITQLIYIRRVITMIILIITIGAVLLTFNTMRKVGTGLLTGVGIGGIIVGFAAQRSLGNLLAGFQIAFTQPMRIDDEVVVENEFGRVEEITLTYVVIRIWDDRRLVLPINYFIEKPFQNWTRTTSDITGTVYLYTDYSLPVEWVRGRFKQLIENHPLWDKRIASLAVTDLKQNVMELRAVVSAGNSGNAWDLRCFLREQLIKSINEHYPQCLPKARAVLEKEESGKIAEQKM